MISATIASAWSDFAIFHSNTLPDVCNVFDASRAAQLKLGT